VARSRRNYSVLLLEDDDNLGHVGDVVTVKPGYARNYLIPTGRACPVTPDALQQVERAKARAAELRRERAEKIAATAGALDGLSLTLEERASEEGHLFGSVGITAIVEALGKQGIEIGEKQIALEAPLKELGIFNVPIRLDAETTVEIRVWVVEPT
jgi:large subunit ribosomal protein L9